MGGYFADTIEEKEERDDDLDDFDLDAPEVLVKSSEGASPRMEAYFAELERRMRVEYQIAEQCRALGLDPEMHVEIPPAADLAARVEELMKDFLPQRGVAVRIRELSKLKNREETSLLVAKEVAAGRFGSFESKEKALDGAIRVGLAILTEGILVAPLEGIAGVRILKNDDGTDCVSVSYAGPIRAAGGTGQALSVLIADVVRRELGYDRYKPTQAEVDRLKEEIPAYKMAQHLQYTPPPDEIDLIVRNCPIMVDGEGTEDVEISGNRDLPRFETNKVRGGACLVIAEGLTLKAPKIQKHVKNLKLEGWEFIDKFVNKGKGDKAADGEAPKKPVIEPNPKYLLELVAGRPVFAYPTRKGGWRLRYGRARTGGLATLAFHPASMVIVDDFLAVGTQMKIERPGKATVATPCDTIEGPVVLTHAGSLVEVTTAAEAIAIRPKLRRIVDLGEILIPFGEFAENNKTLPQASYCVEWWEQEVALKEPLAPATFETAEEAIAFAERTGTPLHPRFNLFWHDLTPSDVRRLGDFVLAHGKWRDGKLVLPRALAEADPATEGPAPGPMRPKDLLVELGALHEATPDEIVLGRHSYALLRCLGLDASQGRVHARAGAAAAAAAAATAGDDANELVSALAGVKVRPRAPYRVGTRMGRPEKAAERKMAPPVHGLVPLGVAAGAQRLMKDAAKLGTIDVEVGMRQCPACKRKTIRMRCPECGAREGGKAHTVPLKPATPNGKPEPQRIPFAEMLNDAQKSLELDRIPESIKGVVGLISRSKTPEPIEKAILRAMHDVYTFKDGTARFDMTDITLTHFKPKEVHTSVARLRELGYTHDVKGAPLERDDQVLEIFVQDVITSTSCLDYMLKCAQFVDDLLKRVYGFKAYYNAKTREDMVGQMFVALAPHTSGGVLCRIIGHTKAQGHFGHPYFHAAKRRNCVTADTEVWLVENPDAGAPQSAGVGLARSAERARPDAGAPQSAGVGLARSAERARGKARRVQIGAWVEEQFAKHVAFAKKIDKHGTQAVPVPAGPHVVSLDPATGVPRLLKVTTAIRGRTETWVRIVTATGKRFVCTPDHNVLTRENGAWVVKSAEKVSPGDLVPVALQAPALAEGIEVPAVAPAARVNEWFGVDVVVRADVVESAGATYCLDVDSGSRALETKNVLWGNGLYQIRCDGDEDCMMLLLDGLINFSRAYLPSNRGGLMDAPLTLTTRLDPSEVDKEAHNVDCVWRYPLEFFEATTKHPSPKDVEKLIETVAKRLGKPGQYEGIGFTHDTRDIAEGPDASAYKTIGSMMEKMEAQLDLALKIRACDAPDVAARVIGSHFLPDLMGNLKAFSKQGMRCTKCQAKYRRIPLSGKCIKNGCGGNLTMTVYEASVKKYLEVSKRICEKYNVNDYVRQRIEHIEDSIDSLFNNDRVKKAKLSDFL